MLDSLIPWESFREILDKLYKNSTQGGRLPYDPVIMLKILVLQSLCNISDEEMIPNRRQNIVSKIFENRAAGQCAGRLKKSDVYELVFTKFNDYLDKKGYKAQAGQMVDAAFQHVPIHGKSS